MEKKVARRIAEVETAGERLEELRREQKRVTVDYEKAAAELTAKREAGAAELSSRVEKELKPLAMERTVFRIVLDPAAWSETGGLTACASWCRRTRAKN